MLLNKILIVEDSISIQELLRTCVNSLGDFEVLAAQNYAAANSLINSQDKFLCAILDLNLPDAAHGEIVELVQQKNIPIIVLTASMASAIEDTMSSSLIIDYIVKRNFDEIKYAASKVERIYQNQFLKVLIVDDSRTFREYLSKLLNNLRYEVLVANDGVHAMNIIEEEKDICLVITDNNMPRMGGLELIQEIRSVYKREELAILGLSGADDKDLTVKLLKTGANDYMDKSFMVNEFYCRVLQNTNMVNYFREIREISSSDYLTKVKNRRSLFEFGEFLYETAKRENTLIATAMIDADHFKLINDEYGHDAGDKALISLANTLTTTLRKNDIIARFGGEEFVCITVIKRREDAQLVFEKVRAAVENIKIKLSTDDEIGLTVSIGVTTKLENNLEAMIKLADKAVYLAKEDGRNQVVVV